MFEAMMNLPTVRQEWKSKARPGIPPSAVPVPKWQLGCSWHSLDGEGPAHLSAGRQFANPYRRPQLSPFRPEATQKAVPIMAATMTDAKKDINKRPIIRIYGYFLMLSFPGMTHVRPGRGSMLFIEGDNDGNDSHCWQPFMVPAPGAQH